MKVTKNVPDPTPPVTYTIEDLSQDEAQFIRDILGRVTAYSNGAYDVFQALHTALGGPTPQYKFTAQQYGRNDTDLELTTIKATKRS